MNHTVPYPAHLKDKKILAIDFGTKVTGLAMFHAGQDPFPQPWGKLIYSNDATLISDLKKLVEQETVEILVLGVPLFLDGKASTMTQKVLQFGQKLQTALPHLPLFQQDETLSTYEAQSRMKNSPRYNFKIDPKQIDALAASIILEDFLRNHGPGTP